MRAAKQATEARDELRQRIQVLQLEGWQEDTDLMKVATWTGLQKRLLDTKLRLKEKTKGNRVHLSIPMPQLIPHPPSPLTLTLR